jgi:O-acetylserine/cysteine efflux transporter
MSDREISSKDYMLAVGVVILWGANFSFIKMGLDQIDPLLLTLFRFLLSAVPFIFFVKKPDVGFGVLLTYGFLFGFGLWGIVNLAIYMGLAPGLSSLIIQFSAFFTVALSYFIFKERINELQYLGGVIACLGLILIILNIQGESSLIGVSFALVGAISWSLCNIVIKKYQPNDMLSFVVWSSLFSTIPLLLITLAIKGPAFILSFYESLNDKLIFSLVSQSYLTTIFGYWAWNSLIRRYSAAMIAPLALMVPVFAIIVGVLFFDEALPSWKFAAATLIVIGVSLFTFSGRIMKHLYR